ncbi:MAG TPA: hypothetical protein PKZ24_06080 [Nitrospirales bacterium]|nr:hypothetical protein [Nitrospirales bacterium]
MGGAVEKTYCGGCPFGAQADCPGMSEYMVIRLLPPVNGEAAVCVPDKPVPLERRWCKPGVLTPPTFLQ